jgi:16S rRNA A1518/A1519 N6-dimethyltransferase RsmA/KsgA/DIM1 with predicted DNA glycosylase/AP lyase activity
MVIKENNILHLFSNLPYDIQVIIIKNIIKENIIVNSHIKYLYPDINIQKLYEGIYGI